MQIVIELISFSCYYIFSGKTYNNNVPFSVFFMKGFDFMSTTLIIGIAAVLAVVIIILLATKIIKQFVGLLLIILIAAGAFFGIKYLDGKTNLRTKIPSIDAAFAQMETEGKKYELSGIQANYVSKDMGITVIYLVNVPYSEEAFAFLSEKTRSILLSEENYQKILSHFGDTAIPSEIHMLVKWEGLSGAEYIAKRTGSSNLSDPNALYGAFAQLIGTPTTATP